MTWERAYTGLARGDVQNYTKSMLVLVQYGLLVCTAHLSGVFVGTVLKSLRLWHLLFCSSSLSGVPNTS